MKCCNVYENQSMLDTTGETMRPGGFKLTEKGVRFCKLSPYDTVLDLGCGIGATVNYLYQQHNIKAVGVDSSVKLIEAAKEAYVDESFVHGNGEQLPFLNNSFDCVFAECTLSLMKDLNSTMIQVSRVLKENGWFIITDVYAKNPCAANELNKFSYNNCMRRLHVITNLEEKLKSLGFDIILSEDHSHFLKELFVKIAFSYGSMSVFWNVVSENCIDGFKFQEALKLCKPGYFMVIARKGGNNCG